MAPTPAFRVDVRKLPPSLTESEFLLATKDYSQDIAYQYFVAGKIKEKETIFSRAHLTFVSSEKSQEFIGQFKQKFVDKLTNVVYEPIVCNSLFQVAISNKDDAPLEKKDFRAGIMYAQFKAFQEQAAKLAEQKADLSQIERKANEDTADEKAKKFEKVKTPILVSLEQKKKEERAKKLKEKISQGANQVWVPKKN